MQSESWYKLVEKVFPHRKAEMDYLRGENERREIAAAANGASRRRK